MKYLCAATKQGENISETGAAITFLNPTWAGLSEMDMGNRDSIDELQKHLPKHRLLTAPPDKTRSREVPIAFTRSRRYKVQSTHVVRLSKRIAPPVNAVNPGLGNERYATVVRYARLSLVRKKVVWLGAAVAIHLNAGIQDNDGSLSSNLRATVTDKIAMPKVAEILSALEMEGRTTQIVGDCNWKARLPRSHTWKNSPDRVFAEFGMDVAFDIVDRAAHSKQGWKTVATQIIDKGTRFKDGNGGNLGDHNWILRTIKRTLR